MHLTLMESCRMCHASKLFLAFIFASMFVNVLGRINNITGSHAKFGRERSLEENAIVKTFRMENGDIVDCFDIYKQPGFNHPLLQGQRAELESVISQHLAESEAKNPTSRSYISGIECPVRTVPALRRMKQNPKNVNAIALPRDKAGYWALQRSKDGQFDGFRATLAVYPVNGIDFNQVSLAMIWLASFSDPAHDDRIVAGWRVAAGDGQPRLHIGWRSNGQGGCMNVQCDGFLSTTTAVFPRMLQNNLSVVGGPQYDITLTILRSQKTPAWRLFLNDKEVGFWPAKIFKYMVDKFTQVRVGGGGAVSLKDVRSPPMDSGLELREGRGKAAYISKIEIAEDQTFVPANGLFIRRTETDPRCYKVGDVITEDSQVCVYYGGPGGCTLS